MKSWNKAVLSLLAASLLATAQPVFAEEAPAQKVEQQQTLPKEVQASLDKLLEAFPEMKKMGIRDQSYLPENDFQPAGWYFGFDSRPEQPVEGKFYGNGHVKIDESGLLRNMHLQLPEWAASEAPDHEKAKAHAQKFLEETLGEEKAKEYQISHVYSGSSSSMDDHGNSLSWTAAGVQFERLINGIPFHGDSIHIEVDSQGHIASYQRNEMKDIALDKFPSPSKAISSEEVHKIYREKMEMKLAYNGHQPVSSWMGATDKKVETKSVLKYEPNWAWQLNALTGEEATSWDHALRPKEQKINLNSQGKILTIQSEEEFRQVLKEEFDFDSMDLVFEQRVERHQPYADVEIINYELRPDYKRETSKRKSQSHAFASVNKNTGQVLHINLHSEKMTIPETKISEEDAVKTALEVLGQYAPTNVKEMIMMVQSFDQPPVPSWVDESRLPKEARIRQMPKEYHINFSELHQGIPVHDRSYHVTIDGATGQLTGFGIPSYAASKLPEGKPAISAEEAKDIYLEKHPLVLRYIWEEYMGQKAPAPQLVYQPQYPSHPSYLDALTGKVVESKE
ncbi:YcdB/YcdC domain-containing protein [Ammoniphilus sp. CFH 90114]|uniref:YcdB/YcdC domain-containing protein n=1 Tax=Ammoniphilus sp. CFH 90114 TaxID=2493665 RepID=UPI00100EF6A2|nr:YcdB/YcdC domain-containing protein [Ammoniphilus sp. CFH 90114]RXT03935.1 hypothetical protein EIZ39_22530 [Ammoniphilus sp. CFH 90114]